ncbi:hypothetical protein [Rhodococcus sp. NPDC058521]|uniref:hypothetical protein n=1 Tax=Rhodococcus sp. NPDC058521 TaxID=3346536 RepID=UPI003663C07E
MMPAGFHQVAPIRRAERGSRRTEWVSLLSRVTASSCRTAQRALTLTRHGSGFTLTAPYGLGSITVSDADRSSEYDRSASDRFDPTVRRLRSTL